MRIWLIHGFNTDGPWVEPLAHLLRGFGHECHAFRPTKNRTGLLRDLFVNYGDSVESAHRLAEKASEGDVAIGHSNGPRVIHMAQEYGAPFSRCVYLSPALDRSAVPGGAARIDVFHTRHDWAVKMARFIPGSLWGDMGAVGYQGDCPRYVNHDYSDCVDGHSDWFTDIHWLAREINRKISPRRPTRFWSFGSS